MLLIGSSTLFSCSNNEDELPPKEQEQTNQETYTISFNLGGEFISTSETPLSRTEVTPKKIYGMQQIRGMINMPMDCLTIFKI